MYLTLRLMAMTPEHEFFQHKEQHHAGQHGRQHIYRRSLAQTGRNHPQKGGTEQRAGRIADQTGHQPLADALRKQQQQRGDRDGPDAAQQTEPDHIEQH